MMSSIKFPRQTLSFKQKGDKWRKECVDWGANHTYFNFSPVREDIVHMKVNYDLVNGKIHMEDVTAVLNPGNISTAFVPDKIQHYPIINSKLNTLLGEEAARVFDWKAIVTNPFSVSKIEEEKKAQMLKSIEALVSNQQIDQAEAEKQLQEIQNYYTYSWKDIREIRCNELLKHYSKEQDFPQIFNNGFWDAMTNAIEAYYCNIVGGEPVLTKLNPMKLRVYMNGYSSHIEDADVIVYEDYVSPAQIIDTYYDELTTKDIKWLSDEIPALSGNDPVGAAGNYNEAYPFISRHSYLGGEGILVEDKTGLPGLFDQLNLLDGGLGSDLLPYDVYGNVRVVKVWWKSRRKIYRVKSFDPNTGEEIFDFYPETYVPDTDAGEEADPLWINEAWEGTKIGENIYVGMRPCLVQHNSLSNPSRCHFGIVGTIYNFNEAHSYSLVDMMKPYNYLYDAIHAKLVDLIATNWGKLLELDLAMKPKNWEVEKWMYFARANKVLIKDSFREGDKGAATGKLAGGLNNASKGYIDADWGSSIQNYINLLEWTKNAMSEIVGINRQREGQTYNRETVGGIERAVLQSSYITDWLFQRHDNTKKRVLTTFLEVAKGALRGRSMKFKYVLSDMSTKVMDIPGDEFCECDYGIIVESSGDVQRLNQQIESLAQVAIQNNSMDFATALKLFSTYSTSEKIRIVENSQLKAQEMQAQQMQQAQQAQQQQLQAEMQQKQMEMQQKDALNQRDNETKLKVAEINSRAEELRLGIYAEDNNIKLRTEELNIEREKLRADIDQFDRELKQRDKEFTEKKELEMKKIEVQQMKKRE